MTPPTARRPQTPHRHDSRRRLPATLDQASLAAAWGEGGASAGGLKARTVIALWQPRGDAKAPTEVALLWSDAGDKGALRALFSGKNTMSIDEVCGAVVLSSTSALMGRIKAACKGTTPSLAFAEPPVVEGLKQAQSVSLLVDLGGVLSALLERICILPVTGIAESVTLREPSSFS
ncbi:MAG: hypothetical protein IT383_28955 [Deltaproteobacteria bacterium]|nr:hypothetical protein [Deltaproteobacteria bacterium]